MASLVSLSVIFPDKLVFPADVEAKEFATGIIANSKMI